MKSEDDQDKGEIKRCSIDGGNITDALESRVSDWKGKERARRRRKGQVRSITIFDPEDGTICDRD